MSQIQLFAVAAQQAQWLSVRQSTIAENIANANTPGYRPSDIEPFAKMVENAGLRLAVSSGGHISGSSDGIRRPELAGGKTWEIAPSGNSVSLEQELIKADEVNRAYALNASVTKAFHRMLMMSVK